MEKKQIDLNQILEIEQYFKVSRNAVLIRLIQEGYITQEASEQYKINIIKKCEEIWV